MASTNNPPSSVPNGSEEKSSTESDDEIIKRRKNRLSSWLNKYMKIEMTDGRVLIGTFVCTDKDANVILSACSEFINAKSSNIPEEPRMLGLVMVPGRHIVSIHLEQMYPVHELATVV